MTPAGNTYEGADLKKHISINGAFDPVTRYSLNSREPFDRKLIFKNTQLKQAVSQFLDDNPWAYDYKEGESFMDIEL